MKPMKVLLAKTMWVGRTASTVFGLALVMALMLGAGTTALAAVPGDPFKLGQLNAVDAASTLVGRVNGAMLNVQNQSPGSRGAPAPALSLRVAPNNPPLTANPEAGTATNLSADELDGRDSTSFADGVNGKAKDASKADFATSAGEAQNAHVAKDASLLDGKDSTAFANGTNGKAKDADKLDGKDSADFVNSTFGTAPNANNLDGKDSTRFFSGKTYMVESVYMGPGNGGRVTRVASCDEGDSAIGGGGGSLADDPMLDSAPLGPRTWFVTMQDELGESEIRAVVLCADFLPLR